MKSIPRLLSLLPAFGLMLVSVDAHAQNFRVQCPTSTPFHDPNNVDPTTNLPNPGSIKCQQIAGGDGYATMGDGNTIYLFGFGPLSGLSDIYRGLPGTQPNATFNTLLDPAFQASTPSTLVGMPDGSFSFNGAIGLVPDLTQGATSTWSPATAYAPSTVLVNGSNVYQVVQSGTSCTLSTTVTSCPGPTATGAAAVSVGDGGTGSVRYKWLPNPPDSFLTGHVDARPIMDVGVMNANQPAPLIAIDEDDELFLTLTNVGMIMRPDLFEQHTVHFHGYPNASSFYDGVPDASIAINVGGSFTYYYLAPDAGTYFWHCHIAPPEHLQMGMVGQLYVRPRQNRIAENQSLFAALNNLEAATLPSRSPTSAADWLAYEPVRKRCGPTTQVDGQLVAADILCTTPLPIDHSQNRAAADPQTHPNGGTGNYNYAYNDGDGSTYYDVEYPIQIHGFDPNFHFVGMTFNPESFNDMKDKYFMLNGRSYPDTVGGHVCTAGDLLPACNSSQAQTVNGVKVAPGPMETQSTDGTYHASQPLPTVINIPTNGKALLRISDLDVSEYQTLASLGIPMRVVGLNARLLRDMAGNNMAYNTNSITLAGGESIDVILDATGISPGQKFFLYTPNLDHLSNDAENFGGLMTEVNICNKVDPQTKSCT